MRSEKLSEWLKKWDLSPAQGAKVLCVSKSKMSEWLSETNDRQVPQYVLAHLESFDLLSKTNAQKIIQKRLKNTL